MSYAEERRVAIEAVQTACSITTKVFESLVSSESITKKDKSPVTIGDFSAQAAVNVILAHHFRTDAIVGEENSADLVGEQGRPVREKVSKLVNDALLSHGQSETPLSDDQLLAAIDKGDHAGGPEQRFWALDPIDGTKGFLRGGQYAVCLALVEKGEVLLGAMGCPNLPLDKSHPKPKDGEIRSSSRDGLGVMFVAVKGHGAFQRPIDGANATETPVSMRDLEGDFSRATFCESVEAGHSSFGTTARVADLLHMTKEKSVRMDSQAKYASIARGDGDVYLRLPVGDGSYQEKIWDHAAGALIVEEADGCVSDIAGRPLDFSRGRTLAANRGVIACTKPMHARLAKAVAQALEEEGRGHLLK
ncbi:3'(2'),5'-bisphosphate nucleotidase [Malassezia sp. CBS 17886]|nr:3'(2'),5'-bisphosphate nucleotidase [Malassezia sp. CBS 17886]